MSGGMSVDDPINYGHDKAYQKEDKKTSGLMQKLVLIFGDLLSGFIKADFLDAQPSILLLKSVSEKSSSFVVIKEVKNDEVQSDDGVLKDKKVFEVHPKINIGETLELLNDDFYISRDDALKRSVYYSFNNPSLYYSKKAVKDRISDLNKLQAKHLVFFKKSPELKRQIKSYVRVLKRRVKIKSELVQVVSIIDRKSEKLQRFFDKCIKLYIEQKKEQLSKIEDKYNDSNWDVFLSLEKIDKAFNKYLQKKYKQEIKDFPLSEVDLEFKNNNIGYWKEDENGLIHVNAKEMHSKKTFRPGNKLDYIVRKTKVDDVKKTFSSMEEAKEYAKEGLIFEK